MALATGVLSIALREKENAHCYQRSICGGSLRLHVRNLLLT